MKARDVVGALYQHFHPRYAVLSEVCARPPAPTGGRRDVLLMGRSERRCDVLLLGKDERIAVEVKVTRADFLADVRDPSKQATWVALTHRQAYAAPRGLVGRD